MTTPFAPFRFGRTVGGVVTGVMAFAVALAPVAAARVTPLQISSDPYSMTTSQHATESQGIHEANTLSAW
jgi:hypothetical protein